MAKGGGQKKRFQYCLNPHSSEHFLYFKAIQGHSGGTLVDLTVQDNVLLPDDVADCIHHIGNARDMHSIIQCVLIPGGKSLKRNRQSVFFTAVNPMYTSQDQEEVQYDPDKPRIAVYRKDWRIHQNTVYWCDVKLAQRKGLQFYQTRCNAIALFNTLPAICIEKENFSAKYINPQGYREPYSRRIGIMDVRIFLIPKREHPATVKANEARRTRKLVAVLLITGLNSSEGRLQSQGNQTKTDFQQFETHPNRDSLIEDLDKTEEFRSAKSRRSGSPAWVTRSTSSCARSHLKYNALIVFYIGSWHRTLHLRQMRAAVGKGIDS